MGDAVLPPIVLVLRAAFLGNFMKVQGGVPGTAATVRGVHGSVSDPGEKCCGVSCGNVVRRKRSGIGIGCGLFLLMLAC